MSTSSRELLVIILDTNPIWWNLMSTGKIGSTSHSSILNINNAANKDNVILNKENDPRYKAHSMSLYAYILKLKCLFR